MGKEGTMKGKRRSEERKEKKATIRCGRQEIIKGRREGEVSRKAKEKRGQGER